MMRKILQQGIALMLVTTQVVWAAPMPAMSLPPVRETPSFLQIEIPEELATVDEVFEAPASEVPKVIMHIQNVHGNYQAQVQVKKILDYFYKQYGFKTIFAEGAAEKLDSKYLEMFPDQKDNLLLADELAKQGQLTGPELYMMEAPKDVQAIGIEQADLYRGNYDAFRAVYKAKKGTDSFLKQLDSRLELLSSRFLTRDMRRVLSEWQKFHEGRREFMPFVRHLAEEAQKFLNTDLNSLFAQVEWPQTARLLVLQSMESDLNHDEALKERDKLVEFLKQHKASDTLLHGLMQIEEKTISLQRVSGGDEDLYQPRKLLERLATEAAPHGFQFHQYPHFSLYAGYTILESELDSKVLFQEIEKLFARILESLTVSEKEKNVLELYKDLELLKKLMALELTRTEWDQATYRKDWIKPQSLVERLDKMSESGFVTEELKVSEDTPKVFAAAFRFYDFARQREFAFYDTIEKEMAAQKTDRAILVTGGFHTDGLTDIFRAKGINYGVLTPRMGSDFDKAGYIHTLMETHPTLFDLAQMEAIAKLMDANRRFSLGGTPGDIERNNLSVYLQIVSVKAKQLKANDVKGLRSLLMEANKAIAAWGPGAALRALPDTPNAFYLAFYNPETASIEPLRTRGGKILAITINGRGIGAETSRPVVFSSVADLQAEPAKVNPVNRLKNAEAPSYEFRSDSLNFRSGRLTRSSPLIGRDSPDLGFDSPISRPALSEGDMGLIMTPKELSGMADYRLQQGDIPGAVKALARMVETYDQLLSLIQLRKQTGDENKITVATIARKLAAEGKIEEHHAAALELLFAGENLPGAASQRVVELLSDAGFGELAADIAQELSSNPKQYLTLILPEGISVEDFTRIDEIFAPVRKAAGHRFKLITPDRLNVSDVIRMMLSLMQRVKDLGPGSMIAQEGRFFVQGNPESPADTDEAWRPFAGTTLHNSEELVGDPNYQNARPEARTQFVILSNRLLTYISRHIADKISEKLAYLLQREDEKTFLLQPSVLGLVQAMIVVMKEFDKSA